MAIFEPRPWVNRFGKMSIFRLAELLVFIAQKGVFSFYNIEKDILLGDIAQKKKLEKWPFLHQNHEQTPLKNCQFFDFLTSCFYSQDRRFCVLEYRETHFPGLYCLRKKLEKWTVLDENHGLIPLEKCQFSNLLNFLILQPRQAFFRSRIS